MKEKFLEYHNFSEETMPDYAQDQKIHKIQISKFPHLPTFTYEKTFQDMSNYAATSQISVADYERM